jgi:hypothetical protein
MVFFPFLYTWTKSVFFFSLFSALGPMVCFYFLFRTPGPKVYEGRRGRVRVVVGFTTTLCNQCLSNVLKRK